ncbi:bifunctional 4-hydroxy-2-oxoglutarate aldolase/2-dehydro-3-deoxy-phosphogluconate aldolase [Microbacterium sp. NPDC089696]|uniref:bifunctional 4-hydroxy-2-oxoglutarate aldolase/2-dehydro-3-deoxy-phosphogluconate aldolase n=1 Tax=Microbacterium sp. NPDC089696 TaxID=3364199 RepID=UPI003819B464
MDHTADALDIVARSRLVPLATLPTVDSAAPLGEALEASGLKCVEVTLRSEAGLEGIRILAKRGDLLVGAGTVLSASDVERVVDAGAGFIVSPGIDPEVVARAGELGVAVLPGVATASEVQLAYRLGLQAVKFFPAEQSGGLATIGALAAPFAGMRFMPSGGITAQSAPSYLAHPAVLAVSGSWMLPGATVAEGDVPRMTRTLRAAVDALRTDAS